MPEFIARPDGLPPVNGYSHIAVASGVVVFISGQVPLAEDGVVVGAGDATAQADQVFKNLQTALQASGVTWSDVVKLNYFITDMADLAAVRAVRNRYVDLDRSPASSLVQVVALVHPDFKVEIDAIAVRANPHG